MQIEGTYTLQAPSEKVWSCLKNQHTIQHALPGLERLTRVDEHTYAFALQIRYAPLRGMYVGRVAVSEQSEPFACHLTIEDEEPAHALHCACDIRLTTHNGHTVVNYQGVLQPGRTGKLIPEAQVKATIKMLLQQFFTALTDELRRNKDDLAYITTLEEMYEAPFMEEQSSEQLLLAHRRSAPDFLHRLVRLAGLGQQNPKLEEQWVQRLRQVGFMAMLLLLVWVGTRLPRKPVRRP